ncbi:TonB-dependent siderophore receptor [Acidovorax sp. GBBC 3334]|uniref:TonB-dependent siderophore receptor n=1 Tax=unclassified Acidovorax TaxID=2684926 RepID=UPI0023044613|nr:MULTISPECIES: TonB-dependent siderophore receptor [unclassified Acidovorax]MDA8454060.1 TonB-dependent siderophore receptor [Acidovorax sp. GBBC 3334]MDA8519434.1 TonB-dependent siderophore receptor [Acidovorax sp. NCPPB 4044]
MPIRKTPGAVRAVLAAGLLPWAAAHAADATLSEVRVDANAEKESATGPVVGYRARNAATATKTDTPLSETPQSVTVVTRDQMVDQGATTFQGALLYAAGVRSDAYGLDSRSDSVRVRGSYPDIYLDGLRQSYNWYTSTAPVEPYALERLEVLRGPSGMLFGAGTVAGVVNMVSKRPQQEAQREVGVQIGSWNRKQLQADLTGPLTADGQWSYRLVALGRDADTQVDHVPNDRRLIAPSLAWKPNAATSLVLQAFWQKDHSGSTSQFLPWSGTLLPNPNGQLPTSRFIGEPGDYYDTERTSLGYLFEHRFDDAWTLRQNLRWTRNENRGAYHYADFFTIPGGWGADPVNQRMIGRLYGVNATRTHMAAVDTSLLGRLRTGAAEHQLLLGFDWNRQAENKAESGDGYNQPIDAYAPVYGNRLNPTLIDQPKNVQRQNGIYVQDQIKLDRWIVVAGLRHDRAVNAVAGSPDDRSSATTKRLGVMYQLGGGWTPYVSYAESFSPVSGTNAYGARFKPLQGEQVEVGVKYLPEGGSTAFTAAVYDLKEKNQKTADPTNPMNSLQAGQTRNKGLELELKTRVSAAFDVLAHYNYTDVDPALEGLPRNQAAVWGLYRFSIGGVRGFSVGAGARYLSAFRDGAGPRVPSALVGDAMLAYDSQEWRYALNINNVADKQYMSTCLSRGDCWWATRRNVVLSATYRF